MITTLLLAAALPLAVPTAPFAGGRARSSQVVHGIDFGKDNDYAIPFAGEGNWLMNPGFESGTILWRRGGEQEKNLVTEAHSGKYAYRLGKYPASISTLAMPVQKNREFTVSWWGKSAGMKEEETLHGTGAVICGVSCLSWAFPGIRAGGEGKVIEEGSNGWKRYAWTGKYPEKGVRIEFVGQNFIIDDVQVEYGNKAKPYAGTPYGVEILTANGCRTYVDCRGERRARLVVRGPKGVQVTAEVRVVDFFERETYKATHSLQMPNGEQEIAIPESALATKSVYLVYTTLTDGSGGKTGPFVNRVNVFRFSTNRERNRLFHCLPPSDSVWTSSDYRKVLSHTGIVPLTHVKAKIDKENRKILPADPCDVEIRKTMLDEGAYLYGTSWHWRYFYEYLQPRGVANVMKLEKFSPRELDELEDLCYRESLQAPDVRVWKGPNEIIGHWKAPQVGAWGECAKALMAMQRGLHRANPKNVFLAYSVCNLGESGRREIIETFRAAARIDPDFRFDGVDVHPYRPFPEGLDHDMESLIAELKKLGYDESFQIWALEGAYFYPMLCREWNGIAPWAGTAVKDGFAFLGPASYDMGWAERISTAMMQRTALQLYKNNDFCKMGTSWGLDTYDTLMPCGNYVGTAAQLELLGEATWLGKESRFAPGARALFFDDHGGHVVAAVWRFGQDLDKGLENSETFAAKLSDDVEIFDCLANRVSAPKDADGRTLLPLGPFPVYLRADLASADRLYETVNASVVPGGRVVPVGVDFRPDGLKEIIVSVENPLTRSFEGTVSVAGSASKTLAIDSCGKSELRVPWPKALDFYAVNEMKLPVRLESGGQVYDFERSFTVLPVRHVGESFDWKDIPAVPISVIRNSWVNKLESPAWKGKEDFWPTVRIAWNEECLHMRFEVKDDRFFCEFNNPLGATCWYCNDAIQVMFDNFGDGPSKALHGIFGIDSNDSEYDLIPTNATQAIVYRRGVPDHQLTGGVQEGGTGGGIKGNAVDPSIHCDFKWDEKAKMRTYTVSFMAHDLRPMRLVEGAAPGVTFKVYDNDGDIERKVYYGLSHPEKQVAREAGNIDRAPHEYMTLLFIK